MLVAVVLVVEVVVVNVEYLSVLSIFFQNRRWLDSRFSIAISAEYEK